MVYRYMVYREALGLHECGTKISKARKKINIKEYKAISENKNKNKRM